MKTFTRRYPLLIALVIATGLGGAGPAWGEDEPAKLDDPSVEEMAGALGFADSHSEGFWEALTQAVADQRSEAEARDKAAAERAAAERAAEANQTILDAATYGRRTELTVGQNKSFTEYIPPADGDIVDGTINIRTGTELTAADGTKTTYTKYLKPHSTDALGIVVTEAEDGVETVTKVIEYEPGAIDVKVGDSRPVPAGGSSAAGKKPHTFDPKADGSYGQASGGQKDGGAKLAPTEEPVYETVVRAKGDDKRPSRQDFDPIKLPDGRVFTPFLEAKPPTGPTDLPFRSGYTIANPEEWDDAIAQITLYADTEGKIAGVVAEVIGKDGISEIVSVTELIPGSLGLQKGDKRPARDNPGDVATTWDPKPKSSGKSGTTGGPATTSTPGPSSAPSSSGSPTDGGQKTSGVSEGGRVKPDAQSDPSDKPASSGGGTTGGSGEAPAQSGTQGQSNVRWASESVTSKETGNKYTAYEVTNADGSKDIGTKTERPDGTTSCTIQKDGGEQDAACPSGRTEDATCRSDCARFAALAELFFCSAGGGGADCGQPPEGTAANPHAGPACQDQMHTTKVSGGAQQHVTVQVNLGNGRVGMGTPDCSSSDKPGGPSDYGDPKDGDEPVDPSTYDPDDGVTDPADPGEVAELATGGIRLDLYGTLRDPAGPHGTQDEGPAPGRPNPGDTEHYAG